jgi:serine/threonine protein kinase
MRKEKAADESSPEAVVLDEDDVAPAYEPKTTPGISADALALRSGRRAKLVLADSVPPPPPDVEMGEEVSLDIGVDEDEGETTGESSDPYLGKTLADRYEVLAYLGRGSMGTVYSCRHRVLDKRFAIKIIRQDLARDAEAVSRFVTEAKAASGIGSKHIVEVFDFGELPDGAAYIVMEQLEGQTLYQLIADTPRLSISRALGIAIQIAEALGAAHAAGVVHRDLKPDNVFLVRVEDEPDFVKILDFGIAKVLRAGSKLTQAGSVMGTPAYMSPEQAMGTATDLRTDIYALGIMLYEMAAGQVPFDAESPLAVLSMQVSDAPPQLSRRLPEDRRLPPGYEEVVDKCLVKEAEGRFQTMLEVKAALDKIAEGGVPKFALAASSPGVYRTRRRPISVTPIFSSIPPDFRSPGRKKWWVLPAIGLPALAVAGFLGLRGKPPEIKAPVASARPVAPPPPTPETKPEVKAVGSTKEVHLILFPLDARAYHGKEDLGMMPVTVKLKPGEVKHLTVARRGYVTRRLIVDGSKSRLVVGLVAEGAERKLPSRQAEQAADEAAERAAGPAASKPKAEPEPAVAAPPSETAPAPAASN